MTLAAARQDGVPGPLFALGVGPEEERVYRRLLRLGPSSVDAVAEATGLAAEEADRLAESLEARGLLTTSGGDRSRWIAVAPQIGVEALIRRRERELSDARRTLVSLVAEHRDAASGMSGRGGPVELLKTSEALARRQAELEAGVEREMMVLSKAPFVRGTDRTAEVLDLLGRKVECRSVYDRSALDRPGALRTITAYRSAGERIRVADGLPMKILIADRSAALVPVGPHCPGEWMMIGRSDLLDGLVALFELIWSRSVPLSAAPHHDGAGEPLPRADAELLTLLFGGLTDAAIARQTGASVRTVQRRVTRLMLRAGVQSRAQLAWQATRWGWLEEERED